MANKESLTAALAAVAQNPLICRSVIAFVAALSFLLPWVTFDGSPSSTTGSQLAANLFHGSSRGELFSISFTAAVSILTIPFILLVITAITVFKTVRGHDTVPLNAATVGLALLMLLAIGPLTSTAHTLLGGLTQPLWGLVILFFTQLSLAGHTLWDKFGASHPGRWTQNETAKQESQPAAAHTEDPEPHWTEPQNDQVIGTVHQPPPQSAPSARPRRPRNAMPPERRKRFSERMVQRMSSSQQDRNS